MVTTKKIPIEDTKEMRKESEYVTAKKKMNETQTKTVRVETRDKRAKIQKTVKKVAIVSHFLSIITLNVKGLIASKDIVLGLLFKEA